MESSSMARNLGPQFKVAPRVIGPGGDEGFTFHKYWEEQARAGRYTGKVKKLRDIAKAAGKD